MGTISSGLAIPLFIYLMVTETTTLCEQINKINEKVGLRDCRREYEGESVKSLI